MKQHDAGRRGGHPLAMKRPTRKLCRRCGLPYVGLYPDCCSCRGRHVLLALPTSHPEHEPPEAA